MSGVHTPPHVPLGKAPTAALTRWDPKAEHAALPLLTTLSASRSFLLHASTPLEFPNSAPIPVALCAYFAGESESDLVVALTKLSAGFRDCQRVYISARGFKGVIHVLPVCSQIVKPQRKSCLTPTPPPHHLPLEG